MNKPTEEEIRTEKIQINFDYEIYKLAKPTICTLITDDLFENPKSIDELKKDEKFGYVLSSFNGINGKYRGQVITPEVAGEARKDLVNTYILKYMDNLVDEGLVNKMNNNLFELDNLHRQKVEKARLEADNYYL